MFLILLRDLFVVLYFVNSFSYTFRTPSTFNTIEDYVKDVATVMLQYKLAMVELDYMKREDEVTRFFNELNFVFIAACSSC